MVPDNVEAIAVEVKEFTSQYYYVLTSGGIGPTHDDVSMAGTPKEVSPRLCCWNQCSI